MQGEPGPWTAWPPTVFASHAVAQWARGPALTLACQQHRHHPECGISLFFVWESAVDKNRIFRTVVAFL